MWFNAPFLDILNRGPQHFHFVQDLQIMSPVLHRTLKGKKKKKTMLTECETQESTHQTPLLLFESKSPTLKIVSKTSLSCRSVFIQERILLH